MSFKERVLSLVKEIPEGKVVSYKQIAKSMGKPEASRAVGNALAKNPEPIEVPCHRVVRSDGKIGGYALGREKKERLLKSEGVEMREERIDLEEFRYKGL